MAPRSKHIITRVCIITTQYRDLYYGEVSATDDEIAEKHAVRIAACRHIAYWKGPTGGLTSLAANGPGPGSRIGAPCPMLITGVAHLLDVSDEARSKFDAMKP